LALLVCLSHRMARNHGWGRGHLHLLTAGAVVGGAWQGLEGVQGGVRVQGAEKFLAPLGGRLLGGWAGFGWGGNPETALTSAALPPATASTHSG